MVAKTNAASPQKLNSTNAIGTVSDTVAGNGKLSDAHINAILATSATKLILAESPSIGSYKNYIKIDSATQNWTTTSRMCDLRWSDSVS